MTRAHTSASPATWRTAAAFPLWCAARRATSLAAAMALSACATIAHGTRQDVTFASTPWGARVVVDGVPAGTTPTIVSLKRGDDHHVRLELDGFEPYEFTIRRTGSGWGWGNLLLGSGVLLGLAIDGATGAICVLTPDTIIAPLSARRTDAPPRGDALAVQFVAAPDPAWTRVATLSRRP